MFYIKYYWILYIYCTSAGIFSLFLFIHKQCENAQEWAYYYNLENSLDKEYDFIVVGGGSAGSLVAGRLAENGKSKVLLIEAGGEASTIFDVPLTAPLLQQSSFDWQYVTVPQESASYGMANRESRWPAGKIVGGTSRLNYMIYLRGHKLDFESWENGYDWNSDDILYYFKRSENQQGKFSNDSTNILDILQINLFPQKKYFYLVVHFFLYLCLSFLYLYVYFFSCKLNIYVFLAKYHGREGPVYVSDLWFRTVLAKTILEAGKELGFKVSDLNNMISSPGFMPVQVTGYNGARWSADNALKKRFNLKMKDNIRILTNVVAEKVLLKNDFEANGIQFRRHGRIGHAYARKSVILSAGTVGTAKILLLSGIGPAGHLQQHNIRPVVKLPVGENLQDHVTTGLDFVTSKEPLPFSSNAFLKSPLDIYQYIINGKGLLTHPGCEVVGLFHLEKERVPDLQLMVLPAGVSTDAGAVFKNSMGITEKLWREYFSPLVGKQVISILPVLLHPKSRGYVRLRSSDPNDPPIINPNYLTDPYDINILIKGLKLIQRLIKTKSLTEFGASLNENSLPGCEQFQFGSDLYLECYVRHLTFTAYHPVGTCKMGVDVGSSVVDHYLRVHQTNRLQVIDASIMPTIPSGNINAAVMMIAEKGVDIVKYLWHTNKHFCHFSEVFTPRTTTPAK